MSGSEEKKLNSLHEEDSLYKAQGGKAAYQISPTYGQNTLYKVNPVHDAWDRALAAESICQDILSSARNQLYLNMRFMDCALSALFFQGDMGVHPVGTDGTVLYYQPEELMEQFRRSQEKVNRIYLHTAFFSTVFQRRMKKEILLWMSSTGILHVTLQWKISLTGFI